MASFLDQAKAAVESLNISAACIGVAGPVDGHLARVTNLPWTLDSDEMVQTFKLGHMQLINDFQAIGYGIPELAEQDLVTLQASEPEPHGTLAVIGAGTGLGEGILVRDGDNYRVLPSEGGHVGFAPHGEVQRQLSAYLEKRFGYVSYELICSGPGLANIYAFMHESFPEQEGEALSQAVRLENADIAAEVSRFATTGEDALAVSCMNLFVDIYAAQAGNLALTCLPRGGLYIAGGIAPRIIPFLQTDRFLEAFRRKGKMQGLMHDFPVLVVMNPEVGLLGAVAVASRLAQ
jgi:glucokinase